MTWYWDGDRRDDGLVVSIKVQRTRCEEKIRSEHEEVWWSDLCHKAEDFFHFEADCHMGKEPNEVVVSDHDGENDPGQQQEIHKQRLQEAEDRGKRFKGH